MSENAVLQDAPAEVINKIRFLRRDIDKPLFDHLMKSYTILISAIAMFVFPKYAIFIAPVHLFFYLIFLGPFITMYHDINHSPLFKNKNINWFVVQFAGFIYGIPPATYMPYHVIMHHPENNMEADVSTTLPYQRDSFKDFMKYYIKVFFSMPGLFRYLWRSGSQVKKRHARYVFIGEISFFLICVGMVFVNPWATLAVFILPLIITRSLLIIGNWGEHAFIDPNEPDNLYTSSSNVLGGPNKKAFNVGYHIIHHVKPSMHYSLLEKEFNDNLETYGKHDCTAFHDMHYPKVWYLVVTKNYKELARTFVRLPGREHRTEEEIIALLKSRVVPIYTDK